MLRKAVLLLLVFIISLNVKSQTTTPKVEGYDTLKTLTGCLYVSDSNTFATSSAYLHSVRSYYWDYQPPAGFKQGDSAVTLVRVKKYVEPTYYIVKDSAYKKVWVQVKVLADFNVDLRKKK
jgi:hypothetical protein